MAKKNLRTPSGTAGLVRYEEDAESKFQLEPKMIIFISVAMIVLEVILFLLF